MKWLFYLFLGLMSFSCFGQSKIYPAIRRSIDSVFKEHANPVMLQSLLKGVKGATPGMLIITRAYPDTLNKVARLPPDPLDLVEVVLRPLSDTIKTGHSIPDTVTMNSTKNLPQTLPSPSLLVWPASALATKYQIGVSAFLISAGLGIETQGPKLRAEFWQHTPKEYIYKKTAHSKPDDAVRLDGRVSQFVIDRRPNLSNNLFYGHASFVTDSFYQQDSHFKGGYIHLRYTIEFVFICRARVSN